MAEDIRIPTEEEIAQLPLWAQVAFAARCARRVQPLFTFYWPGAPKEHIKAVDNAITYTEQSTTAAARAADAPIGYVVAAAYAAEAANAADVARAADAANVGGVRAAALAAEAATRAAGQKAWKKLVVHEIWRDFDKLLITTKKENWDYRKSVPPEFFGPMWPDGAPEGWPKGKTSKDISLEDKEYLKLFSGKDIKQLPFGVQVAFAARCARRIQPLFTFFWPEASNEHIQVIEQTISIIEKCPTAAVVVDAVTVRAIATQDAVTRIATVRATAARIAIDVNADAAARIATTVARAATAARAAAHAAYTSTAVRVVDATNTAVNAAAAAANAAGRRAWKKLVIHEIQRDFDNLLTAAKKEKWVGTKTIPPTFFGPMWPEGAPEGWPEIKQKDKEEALGTAEQFVKALKDFEAAEAISLKYKVSYFEQPTLEFYIKHGNASKETVLEVLNALSEYQRAMGGLGLQFIFDGQYVYASEEVNV